eukprot:NODE_5942_length_380_cov_47.438066_g5229_i0.p2 GENE.NODE_5942_length_380_cov_47.438066_g5229_i0~~NODE_5942_length_380_cov_47.438066_g5229_i0.p2  ORF type:complete len:84 (+),score=6.85 NODE_5942_length_380_cov_47.438066_g5229_i0:89-340(+)
MDPCFMVIWSNCCCCGWLCEIIHLDSDMWPPTDSALSGSGCLDEAGQTGTHVLALVMGKRSPTSTEIRNCHIMQLGFIIFSGG